jgi:hypothetical protein
VTKKFDLSLNPFPDPSLNPSPKGEGLYGTLSPSLEGGVGVGKNESIIINDGYPLVQKLSKFFNTDPRDFNYDSVTCAR